ncbi:MAG: hypothetical protein AAF447_12965, partial [Myxococcota bacterium]
MRDLSRTPLRRGALPWGAPLLLVALLAAPLMTPELPRADAQVRSCVSSRHGVVRRICRELARAGRPERLRQLTFVAFELRAEARPQLWPAEAFRITRHRASWGDVPRIQIVDPKLLFVQRNGLTRPAEVSLA